ncbi:hypothetical protein TanjilG_18700 [Lupinus angustifolius]|uniref:DUF7953 domain-containing protein n=1 Tax=Lupinus angustifolius TaxID=3871 RepID=A0A1J7GPV3_LUPAN|nr:hypothetical protein TanjilG_18700 [Lupinus angustifolius]
MTNFSSKKCKRCGLYEEDRLLSDYEFDEWEFCPSDFASPYGKYVRVKENEFNATFLCPECLSFAGDLAGNCVMEYCNVLFAKGSTSTSAVAIAASDWNDKRKGVLIAVVVLLTVLISAGVIVGVMAAFKYWQKKKREKDQARFLKLFEEGDDIEDELGLGTII